MQTLTEICNEIKNWFVKSDDDKHIGVFEISDGVIAPFVDIKDNQYYRIIGSLYNDGVHRQGDTLIDERFDGAIWLMYIPKQVEELAKEIEDYNAKYGEVNPYKSESFGGYSYTKDEKASSWKNAFSTRLNGWRKIQ